jgi:hypothetical protein
MIISHHFRFIFCGAHRCATTSIHEALSGCNDYEIHTRCEEDKKYFRPGGRGGLRPLKKHCHFAVARKFVPDFEKYFKFCIVRNPWDLMVSKYFYYRCDRFRSRNKVYKAAREQPFLEWIRNPEHRMLVPEMGIENFRKFADVGDVDYTEKGCRGINHYPFEFLEDCMADVSEKIGVPIKLKRLNTTTHDHYSKYYERDQEVIEYIGKQFQTTIWLRNYEFEESSDET